jgi:hypothetical protein
MGVTLQFGFEVGTAGAVSRRSRVAGSKGDLPYEKVEGAGSLEPGHGRTVVSAGWKCPAGGSTGNGELKEQE